MTSDIEFKKAFLKRKNYLLENKIECYRLFTSSESVHSNFWVDCFLNQAQLVLLKPKNKLEISAIIQSLRNLDLHPLPPLEKFHTFLHLKNKTQLLFGDKPETIKAKEWDYYFELELGEQIHTGIFIDQRENRKELTALSTNKRVLNLFCYTGLFSLAALQGQAGEVVSVDLSKRTLEKLSKNISHNSFRGKHKSYAEDAFTFLKRQIRKKEFFDLIILDPPSFSRTKNKTFQIEKNFEELLALSLQVLEKNGKLFFSINTHHLSYLNFKNRVQSCAHLFGKKIIGENKIPLDCMEGKKENFYLKGFWLS